MESENPICRTCLASGVKCYKLDASFIWPESDAKNENKITFLECLNFCTRLEELDSFPRYICTECSRALQIAYFFIQNAIKAHEILMQRIGVSVSTKQNQGGEEKHASFRCKVCHIKVATKKTLKEHIKLHLDVINFCCQICDYECKKRSQLSDHYSCKHNVEATADQLKPFMQPNLSNEIQSEIKRESQEEDPTLLVRLQRHKEQEEAERLLQELEEKMLLEKQEYIKEEEFIKADEHYDNFHITNSSLTDKSEEFNSISAANILGNLESDISVGNEFVVLEDGTVQKVDGSDVVIEYINQTTDGVTILDNLALDDAVQLNNSQTNFSSMDIDDIIEEAANEIVNTSLEIAQSESQGFQSTDSNQTKAKNSSKETRSLRKPQCKICNYIFDTQTELKNHMLSHNEIPHFFCDRCTFYTFFKNDLTQHYKSKHNIQPSFKQLQPRNKLEETLGRAIYSCDLCLYESPIRNNLRRHYSNEHRIEATEVQLRPTIDSTDVDIKLNSNNARKIRIGRPSLCESLTCNICKQVFQWPHKYKQHQLWHKEEEKKQELKRFHQQDSPQIKQNSPQNLIVDNESTQVKYTVTEEGVVNATQFNINNNNNNSSSNANTDVILPSDAIPHVVENEQTIEQDMEFDFNGDGIFEDFGENENADDVQDNEDIGDLILTSEDDLDELLEGQNDETNKIQTTTNLEAFCVHCNKRFFSQYHFENHMFIHRGLAPYRCEMCTNLYNTKRALIRHYKAVHKKLPSRDMIQAKGDKVTVDMPSINSEETKGTTYMCAKCPFESSDRSDLKSHLSTDHGMTDENYILQKLQFECSRCIRSFESNARLLRHLERSHSLATITQHKRTQTTTTPMVSSAVTDTVDVASNIEASMHNTTSTSSNLSSTSPRSGIVEQPQPPPSDSSEVTKQWQQQQQEQPEEDFTFISKLLSSSPSSSQSQSNEHEFPEILLTNEDKQTSDAAIQIVSRSYQCSVCHGTYKSQALLKHHFKRHMERKYHCNVCPKKYISRNELEKHTILHAGQLTGQMPHKCDLCSKQFGYPHHLKRHRDVIHCGKRYPCPVPLCDRIFTTQSQMNIHVWAHTGNLPYNCKTCDRSFSKRETLRQHAKKIHKICLTEVEIAKNFRENTGHRNPHDLNVAVENGELLLQDSEVAMAVIGDEESDKKLSSNTC